MGLFDGISKGISNIGKAVGLSDVAVDLGLAGSKSVAAPVAAAVAAYYGIPAAADAGWFSSTAAAAGDAAAYSASGAAAASEASFVTATGSAAQSFAVSTPVVTETALANTGWAATTKAALGVAKDTVAVMTIKNALTGQRQIVQASAPVPFGWYQLPAETPKPTATAAQKQGNGLMGIVQPETQDIGAGIGGIVGFALILAGGLYYFGKKS